MPLTRFQIKQKLAGSQPVDTTDDTITEHSPGSDSDQDSTSDYAPSDTEEPTSHQVHDRKVTMVYNRSKVPTRAGVLYKAGSEGKVCTRNPSKSENPPAPKPPLAPPAPPLIFGAELVNKCICVRFGEEWLPGRITKYDANNQRHSLTFDDFNHGSLEPVNLNHIDFVIVEHESKKYTTGGSKLESRTTTTTHWTTDTTTVTKVMNLYNLG